MCVMVVISANLPRELFEKLERAVREDTTGTLRNRQCVIRAALERYFEQE